MPRSSPLLPFFILFHSFFRPIPKGERLSPLITSSPLCLFFTHFSLICHPIPQGYTDLLEWAVLNETSIDYVLGGRLIAAAAMYGKIEVLHWLALTHNIKPMDYGSQVSTSLLLLRFFFSSSSPSSPHLHLLLVCLPLPRVR